MEFEFDTVAREFLTQDAARGEKAVTDRKKTTQLIVDTATRNAFIAT
jgi:hypothetical protein